MATVLNDAEQLLSYDNFVADGVLGFYVFFSPLGLGNHWRERPVFCAFQGQCPILCRSLLDAFKDFPVFRKRQQEYAALGPHLHMLYDAYVRMHGLVSHEELAGKHRPPAIRAHRASPNHYLLRRVSER